MSHNVCRAQRYNDVSLIASPFHKMPNLAAIFGSTINEVTFRFRHRPYSPSYIVGRVNDKIQRSLQGYYYQVIPQTSDNAWAAYSGPMFHFFIN